MAPDALQKRKRAQDGSGKWITTPLGFGRFLNTPVLFAAQDRQLIVSTKRGLKVYDLPKGNYLENISIPEKEKGHIINTGWYSKKEDIVFVVLSNGNIYTVELRTKIWTERIQLKNEVHHIKFKEHGDLQRIVYKTYNLKNNSSSEASIYWCDVSKTLDQFVKEPSHIYTGHLRHFHISNGAKAIIFSTKDKLKSINFENHDSESDKNTLNLGKEIYTFAVWEKKIAVGMITGEIFIYDNILDSDYLFSESEKYRRFHWHSQAVKALQWVLEGRYLVSGGEEGVLLLWTAVSGQKQFLPRLGGPIKSISINEEESLYAVHLLNNTIKVIGTSDMEMRAEIAGLFITPTGAKSRTSITLDTVSKNIMVASNHPLTGPLVQIFNPESEKREGEFWADLMTFSGRAGRQNRYSEQSQIKGLAISSNSEWLASIDTWSAARSTLDYNIFSKSEETKLKFWIKRNESFHLNCRIDNPHGPNVQVKAIIASSVQSHLTNAFATVGDDGTIRIWQMGKGSGSEGKSSHNRWTCIYSLSSGKLSTSFSMKGSEKTLAWSADGSIIALGSENFEVQLFTPVRNLPVQKLQIVNKAHDLAFLNQYLIVASYDGTLTVFDLLCGSVVWCVGCDGSKGRLCVDSESGKFAFAVSETYKKESTLRIFDVTSPEPEYTLKHPSAIIGIVNIKVDKGDLDVLAVDSDAGLFRVYREFKKARTNSTISNGVNGHTE